MKYRRVAIFDTETTGLNPDVDRCIEVACTLYDLEHAAPMASFASLIHSEANDAYAVNDIPIGLLKQAPPASLVWGQVVELFNLADVIVAHRAEFDKSFTPPGVREKKPWACSKFDMPWPKMRKPGEGLVHLALAHGLGVAHAHRAMSDVDTLTRLFSRAIEMGADVQEMLRLALRPKARFVAIVSYEQRQVAKDASFEWDGDKREWWRVMAIEDAAKLSFKTKRT